MWPWQWFALQKADRLFSDQYYKNGLKNSDLHMCKIMQLLHLLSVLLCVVRAVHRIGFRLVVNETTNCNRWKESHAGIETHVFDRICTFSAGRRR
jgi:hypothetical protein